MAFPFNQKWATDKGYYHHSNPNRPLCAVMFDKCVVRPKTQNAWKIVKGEITGDKKEAQAILSRYMDDNANMMAGRVAEACAKLVLIEGESYDTALRHGFSLMDGYRPRTWDGGHDKAKIALNTEEFAEVLQNTINGIDQAHKELGLNRVEGQSEIFVNLDGLELPFSGFPDFTKRVELKTKWSSIANTKSGKRSASLPTKPEWNHIQQLAGYWAGTGLMQSIVYVNAKEYRIFNAENCEALSADALQACLNHMVGKLQVRERLLKSTDSVDEMLRLIEPDFKHMWAWDMRPEVVDEAKKLWGFK